MYHTWFGNAFINALSSNMLIQSNNKLNSERLRLHSVWKVVMTSIKICIVGLTFWTI